MLHVLCIPLRELSPDQHGRLSSMSLISNSWRKSKSPMSTTEGDADSVEIVVMWADVMARVCSVINNVSHLHIQENDSKMPLTNYSMEDWFAVKVIQKRWRARHADGLIHCPCPPTTSQDAPLPPTTTYPF